MSQTKQSLNIDNYYEYFNPEYSKILWREGKASQGRELNEMQAINDHRIKGIGNALFKDGDVLSEAQIVVNPNTGLVKAQAGKIYISGAVWDIPEAEFSISTIGTVTVGVRITSKVITEMEDALLKNPAIGSPLQGTPGAWRLQKTCAWGFSGDGNILENNEFYPVYTIDDGEQRAKEAPPNLDSFNLALARYDRDSTGTGTYVVDGFKLSQQENLTDGRQVYSLSEGRGHVAGMGVELKTSRRVIYEAKPDLRFLDTEVHIANASSITETGQRIEVNHGPIKDVTGLRITQEKMTNVVHGAFSGSADRLADTSIISLESVKMGDTVYEEGIDYIKTGDTVDWSPSGNEPAPGSTYEVIYRCVENISPVNLDLDSLIVKGAVAGTQIMINYNQMLPRYDRLAMTYDGQLTWFQGIASSVNPKTPTVPQSMLHLATVHQTWRNIRTVKNDAITVMNFEEIQDINDRVEYVMLALARMQLESDVSTREDGARVGIFVDPLMDDSMRDQGLAQTGAIVGGMLTLPIKDAHALQLSRDIEAITSRDYDVKIIIEQPFRTGEMQVNPYMAFDPLPANVALKPAIDHFTEHQTNWASAVTEIFNRGSGSVVRTGSSTGTELVGTSSTKIEHLRQIDIAFILKGFGNGEELESVEFDGISVAVTI